MNNGVININCGDKNFSIVGTGQYNGVTLCKICLAIAITYINQHDKIVPFKQSVASKEVIVKDGDKFNLDFYIDGLFLHPTVYCITATLYIKGNNDPIAVSSGRLILP